MDATWIVSANAGRAVIYSQESSTAPLEEINDMMNAEARLHTGDVVTDEVGAHRAAGKSRHGSGAPSQPNGYEPNQLPAEHQAELFAKSINDYVLKAHQEGRFQKLVLIASPQFLGVLRKKLDSNLESAIQQEINKDYTNLSGKELIEQLNANAAKA